jgi:molybdate transport system substrate-binding protein
MVWKLFFPLLAVFLLVSCQQKKSLNILTAAGLKEPFQEEVNLYKEKHPEVSLNVVYAGSGSLLIKLEKGLGDLYIPASVSYMETAERKGLIDPKSVKIVAYHEPVLVVRKGIKLKSVYDLAKLNIRLGIADPREAAIGKVSYEILKKAGLWKKLKDKIAVKTPTVNQLILYLKENQIDAAIVWKELALKLKNVQIVEFPGNLKELEAIPIGVSTFSENKKEAEQFENFLLKHRKIFEKYGFVIKAASKQEK